MVFDVSRADANIYMRVLCRGSAARLDGRKLVLEFFRDVAEILNF